KQLMCPLEIRIESVKGIAVPVIAERSKLQAVVKPRASLLSSTLIDVVAEVHNQLDIFLGHVPVSGKVTSLVMLAGGKGKGELVETTLRIGGGAGPPNGAHVSPRAELIPVLLIGLQTSDFYMDRMSEVGECGGAAFLDDSAHSLVGGDLPIHF